MVRDLTKSMLSFSWAMSLFGVEQLVNTLTPQSPSQPTHKVTAAFDAVTHVAEEQLSGVLRGTFKAGDQLQKGFIDVMFSFFSLEAFNPSQLMRLTSDITRQTTGAIGRSFQGGNSRPQPQASGGSPTPPGTSGLQPQAGWGPVSSQ